MLAVLLLVGAGLGSVNLLLDGVLRPGAGRWTYAVTMAALAAVGVLLLVRRRVDRPVIGLLVGLGDLVYVVVALSITDPMRYAPPLMMLFAAFTAAWFLDGWMLGLHLLAVPVACWVALAPGFDDPAALAVQVVVQAVVLDVGLRRGLRAAPPGAAAAGGHRAAVLDRSAHRPGQPPLAWPPAPSGCGGQAQREGGSVAAFLLDLDRFKQLNDEHGHAAGDAVLIAVAEVAGRRGAPGRRAGPHRRGGDGRARAGQRPLTTPAGSASGCAPRCTGPGGARTG